MSVSFLEIVCNHATLAVNKSNAEGSGETFGPYEVHERLGVGGMASVHRAVKRGIEDFERVVALKRLLSHLAEDQSFVKSFVREARLASKLQHANIIQLYDLGRVGRVYYIAMEYVRGRDLRKVLKQTAYATGPMPIPMMLSLAQQLCDALDYAHSLRDENEEPLGIVHRDISPSNLLVAADGHLKVIDFGIAKATAASLRTSSGRVKGKFAYMAPEAIKGRTLDHRSDVFSAGIVCHEMLTARPLFASKNEYDTLQKIANEPVPPPSKLNPDCPPELDEIVLTALAKSPEERWQSAGAMHRALDHVVKKHSLQATRREIAEWIMWAFEQPLQRKRVKHKGLRQRIKARFRTEEDITNRQSGPAKAKKPSLRSSTGPIDVGAVEKANIEIVWGNKANQPATGQVLAQPRAASQPEPPRSMIERTPSPARSAPTPVTDSPSGPRPAPAAQVASRDSAPPAWAEGTPQTQDGAQVTSSYRVTMLGMAPPPEIERFRAEVRQRSTEHAVHPAPSTPAPADSGIHSADSAVTAEFVDPALGVTDNRHDMQQTQRRKRPSNLPMSSRVDAAGEPGAGPAPGISTERVRRPSQAPPSGAVSYPTTNVARRYDPEDREEIEIPRSKTVRVIQIALLIVLCAGAAVVSYLLVAGASGGEGGDSQPAPAIDSSDDSGEGPDKGSNEASDEGSGDPSGARPSNDSSSDTTTATGAAATDAAIDHNGDSEGNAGKSNPVGAFEGTFENNGETFPLIPAGRMKKISGKAPRVRADQMVNERGQAVLIHAVLCIDDQGQVQDVVINDAPEALIKRSRRALKQWRYEPFKRDGKEIPVCVDAVIKPQDR